MANETLSQMTAIVAAAAPIVLIGVGLTLALGLKDKPRRAARAGALGGIISFLLALAASVSLIYGGPIHTAWNMVGPFEIGVYFDTLSAVVLTLVSFLLAVVTRFSVNYLDGDPGQGRFTKWLCLTGGSVLAIVISGNLIQFALAWSATSLCLHKLLLFYPNRPGALLAARKKFMISRLGDAALLGAIVLVWSEFHTFNFHELFAAAGLVHQVSPAQSNPSLSLLCFLLVFGAMLKSAQFPFHSWLPDTMETPTPVSALMHAGIINAGGFLIIRLSPVVTLSPAAMSTLALFGAFTALFASLVMLTHASVKRSLAFSTVAQMGFMMLECGLGAFALALLHLVAHSLYKAYAFLSSGSIHALAKAAWTPTGKPDAQPRKLLAAVFSSLGLIILTKSIVYPTSWSNPGHLLLCGIFAIALAHTLWNLWSRPVNRQLAALGLSLAALLSAMFFLLHTGAAKLIGQDHWSNDHLNTWIGLTVVGVVFVLFVMVAIIQTELPLWANRPLFKSLYVHARNGFYFNTLANRCVAALWARRAETK